MSDLAFAFACLAEAKPQMVEVFDNEQVIVLDKCPNNECQYEVAALVRKINPEDASVVYFIDCLRCDCASS